MNHQSGEDFRAENIFQRIYLTLSRKYSQSLFDSLVNTSPEKLKPSMSLAKASAFAISAIVYLITIFLPVFGISILVIGWGNVFALIIGIASLLIGWFIRPRIPKVPKGVISRTDFPMLYEFTDSIAASLNSKNVDGIIINGALNASFGNYGLAGKNIVYIGLSLWEILSIEEKIALVAHELSHGINGDPMRSLFVNNALRSLIGWYFILRPESLWKPGNGLLGILILPLNIVCFGLSGLVLLLVHLLAHLIYVDSQKSEYLADYLATKTCGTDAMVGLLEKIQIGRERFKAILHKVALRKVEGDLFEDLSSNIWAMSSQEKEKIKRIGESENSRIDLTHPSTFFRIQFLRQHFETGTQDLPSTDKIVLLENEIFRLKSQAQTEIIDIYKSTLYY